MENSPSKFRDSPSSARVSSAHGSSRGGALRNIELYLSGDEDAGVSRARSSRPISAAMNESGASRRTRVAAEAEEDGPEAGATPQLGAEATIRYLKAKLAVADEELGEAQEAHAGAAGRVRELERRNRELEESAARANKASEALRVKADKLSKQLADKGKLADGLERQLAAAAKEREGLEKAQREQAVGAGAKDVRLNRALEEVEKYKRLLSDARGKEGEGTEQVRRQLDAALAEKKRLAKQKAELLAGFKKQMRLIDVLKRQVINVQAAKMLALTEQDFTRALEIGEQI